VNSNHSSGKPSLFLQDVIFIGAVYCKRRNQSTAVAAAAAAACPKGMCFRCLTLYYYYLSGTVVGNSESVLEFYRNLFQKDVYILKLQ